jgi:hypothetical protein
MPVRATGDSTVFDARRRLEHTADYPTTLLDRVSNPSAELVPPANGRNPESRRRKA